MRRLAPLAVLFTLALAVPAQAIERTYTFTSGPEAVDGYSVKQQVTTDVPRPPGDGFITHMSADVVDPATGEQVPINRIMLHHILFLNLGPPDAKRNGLLNAFYG